jgi:hypothetical protein
LPTDFEAINRRQLPSGGRARTKTSPNVDMNEPETQAAWRLFHYNWIVVGAMAVALVAALTISGFSIAPLSALKPAAIISAYIGYAYFNHSRPLKRDTRVTFILGSTGQLLIMPVLITPLTYIAASTSPPLQDAALNALDRAMGLDWMAYFDFIYDKHWLLFVAVLAYGMIGWPVFGVPIVLGWTRRYRRLQIFTLAFGIALAITAVISTLIPALGTYGLYNFLPDPQRFSPIACIEQLRDLPAVRDGTLRHLMIDQLAGIVTFPSFHAAAAALYLWAFWPVRWIGPAVSLVMVAMLLATPVVGGHYFIDVFAGIAVTAVSVIMATWIAERLTRTAQQPVINTAPLPQPAE